MLGRTQLSVTQTGRKVIGARQPYNKYGVVSRVHTFLSGDVSDYEGPQCFGGIQPKRFTFCHRDWDAATEPAKAAACTELPLNTPFEFLVCNSSLSTTADTKVGVDRFHVPHEYVEKLRRARLISNDNVSNNNVYSKCNWTKMRFKFTNYSRHPIKVYLEYNIGDQIVVWNPTSGQPSLIGGVFSGLHTPTHWADMQDNLECIVIPGTLDNGDQGAKYHHDVYLNWNQLFDEIYRKSDADEAFEFPELGPWKLINPEYISAAADEGSITLPFYQTDVSQPTPASQGMYNATMRLHFLIDEPHGYLTNADNGTTLDSAQASTTLDSSTLNVELEAMWDETIAIVGSPDLPKTYGNTQRAGGS